MLNIVYLNFLLFSCFGSTTDILFINFVEFFFNKLLFLLFLNGTSTNKSLIVLEHIVLLNKLLHKCFYL